MLKFQWLQGDFSAPHEGNEAICVFIHTPVNQVHCLYCTVLAKSCCCDQARDESTQDVQEKNAAETLSRI